MGKACRFDSRNELGPHGVKLSSLSEPMFQGDDITTQKNC